MAPGPQLKRAVAEERGGEEELIGRKGEVKLINRTSAEASLPQAEGATVRNAS
jgi:hypothetical protein